MCSSILSQERRFYAEGDAALMLNNEQYLNILTFKICLKFCSMHSYLILYQQAWRVMEYMWQDDVIRMQ